MAAIIALDQGTTSSRASAFDESGTPIGPAQQAFRQIFLQTGWGEHAAMGIWQTRYDVLQEVATGLVAQDIPIGAFGITNQRETMLLWARDSGRPIVNAIVWQNDMWQDESDFADRGRGACLFEPQCSNQDALFQRQRWIMGVERSRAWTESTSE